MRINIQMIRKGIYFLIPITGLLVYPARNILCIKTSCVATGYWEQYCGQGPETGCATCRKATAWEPAPAAWVSVRRLQLYSLQDEKTKAQRNEKNCEGDTDPRFLGPGLCSWLAPSPCHDPCCCPIAVAGQSGAQTTWSCFPECQYKVETSASSTASARHGWG
jgi:hypothetical protein